MRITIESTDRIVEVRAGTHTGVVPGRVWQGKTESGIPVSVVITSLAVPIGENQSEFAREFTEQPHAAADKCSVESFPLRFVL